MSDQQGQRGDMTAQRKAELLNELTYLGAGWTDDVRVFMGAPQTLTLGELRALLTAEQPHGATGEGSVPHEIDCLREAVEALEGSPWLDEPRICDLWLAGLSVLRLPSFTPPAVEQAAGGEVVGLGDVLAEVRRATAKFPTWPTDPLHALGVLAEEYGELSRCVVQAVYEPHKNGEGELRKEAIQTAAMALRFVASLDRYVYTPSEQHSQEATG